MENENNVTTITEDTKVVLNKKIKTCKTCGAAIAKNAKTCPACGAKNKKPIYKRVWIWLFCLVIIFAAGIIIPKFLSPVSLAKITDNNGTISEMSLTDLNAAYADNYQSASDRFQFAKIELTAKVENVGSGGNETYYGQNGSLRFYNYVDVNLEGGWVIYLTRNNEDLTKELNPGDTIHIISKIYKKDKYSGFVMKDINIEYNKYNSVVTDNSIVSIVQK